MSLEYISVPPKSGNKPTHLVVGLHGWGANARDLAPIASMFNLPNYQFIFVDAPFPHPHSSWGRAWYALEKTDYHGLAQSRQMLQEFINSTETTTGVPLNRTILAGFSQGGAMTLDVGLNLPLAGLCCLSGYLHNDSITNKSTFPEVLLVHGRQDQIVPISAAQKALDKLTAIGVKVIYKEFDMGHEITPEVLYLIQDFLLKF